MNSEHGMPRTRACAGADRIGSDQGSTSLGTTETADPSSSPRCEKSSRFANDSPAIELENEKLRAELDRVRAAALFDLQNLQSDIVGKNRRIGQLEAELAKQAEDSPEAQDAKELLLLWRDEIRNGRKNVDIALDSDRGRAMLKALKSKKPANGQTGKERIRRAILGCGYDDWAMGRTSKQDRPYNDVAKHILRDSDRFEHFEGLYERHNPAKPKLELVRPVQQGPLERVAAQLDDGRWIDGGYMTVCPCCAGGLFIRSLKHELGELVLVDCYGTPACDRAQVMVAAGLDAGGLLETAHRPVSWVLPESVVGAMARLLELDAAHRREAA